MNITTGALLQALNLGLIWSIMGIGVFITFRILNFADLTAEGSFVLGMAVVAPLIISGVNPLLATLIAVLAGAVAGLVTGFLHTVLKIPPLLSGILTMTGMFSINLRIMGRPNIALVGQTTLMNQVANLFNIPVNWVTGIFGHTETINIAPRDASIVMGLVFVVLIIFLLKLFFNTEIGYGIRATGDNEPMVKAQGINTNVMKVFGLALGNACVALSGALLAQALAVADVNVGVGSIVNGLAAVIIGEVIFRDKNSHRIFVAVVFGSVIFFGIRAFVLAIQGMNADDFRLITAIMVAIALSVPMFREKLNINFKKSALGSKEGK